VVYFTFGSKSDWLLILAPYIFFSLAAVDISGMGADCKKPLLHYRVVISTRSQTPSSF
jgi:hypothetical protein